MYGKSKETFLELQQREAYLNTPELQHHIATMANPDNFGIDVRMKLYNQLVAEKNELESSQPKLWERFTACTDEVEGCKLLDKYTAGVARRKQLEFLINQAYSRL